MSTRTAMTTENRDQREANAKPNSAGNTGGGAVLGATPCSHDYENFVRKGRARYHCPKCGTDITFEIVMLADVGFYHENGQALSSERGGD